jgi:eukaryotic-like serine/threonine-protein kinase
VSEVDWASVADIFADALERPAAERASFVAERCAGQPEVLAAVERMLAANDSALPGFLDRLDPDLVAEAVHDGDAPPVERIGPWQVVREIGRGGMGRVFLAERADGQFEQRVAVKFLKRGMDSDAILARFVQERRILAGLDHPNIARLLDGGVAEDGRPWFVMEYVDGEPITEWADAARLDVDARVALFRTVCRAVAHAHRNLVVHRDLKPSNILVTRDGHPKLLDFGIAKLLAPTEGPSATPTLTVGDVRLMTPAYAAPEQLTGGVVTTSTDLYGLGAVLYELLSGCTPFGDRAERLALPLDAEPVPLSAAVRGHAASRSDGTGTAEVAAARSTDAVRLRKRLAGDLETIVAVALRADPERRYPTAEALEQDLLRHQKRLPVRARPDTLAYRASRFVRRHRVAVMATASTVLVAVAFGVTATVQARALAAERDRARREATAAREVSNFMAGVFETANPLGEVGGGRGDTIRAFDLLERGARRVEVELSEQPALQGRLLGVIGVAYNNLGWADRAAPLLARAVEIARSEADSVELVAALHRLGAVQGAQSDYPQAVITLRQAVEIEERLGPESGSLWAIQVDLAEAYFGNTERQAGSEALARATELFTRMPYTESPEARAALSRMAGLLGFGPDEEREDSVFARLAAVERAASGDGSARYAAVLGAWAGAKAFRGDLATADSLYARAVALGHALDSTSVPFAQLLVNHASVVVRRGEAERAMRLAEEASRIMAERLGEDHQNVAYALGMLAEAQGLLGLHDQSVENQRRVVAAHVRAEDAVLVPPARWRLAVNLVRARRMDEAEDEYARALQAFEAGLPADHPLAARVRAEYAQLLLGRGRAPEAEPEFRSALDILSVEWGEEDPRVEGIGVGLGTALVELGRLQEARALLRPILERLATDPEAPDSLTLRARAVLERAEGSRPR